MFKWLNLVLPNKFICSITMEQKFNENDIRPEILRKGMEKAMNEDIKTLQGFKSDFKKVFCPACGDKNSHFIFEKYGFSFDICKKCRTVFMNPRPTSLILKNFYENSKNYAYWNKYIFPSSETIRRDKIIKPRVKKMNDIAKRLKIKKNCLVEIGPGYGTFADEVIKSGAFKKVIVIEPNSSCATSCRNRGIETIEKPIEEVPKLEYSPDVIASFEVIEHLYSPKEYLKNCWRIMGDNSIIVATCPNYEGFDILTLGFSSESIDHEHLNLFNPTSISLLFKKCGFRVLECFTPGELDADIVRNKILAGQFNIKNNPFLKKVLLDRWGELGNKFQEFLKNNKFSSHMWVIAKKLK